MHTRWWDSEAALDALDLVDGSDPAMGVSMAVLGYHAIAKQAIAPLGAQTLVDVSHLERAFETADFTEVAEAVHAATCEALGHEAACRYAQAAVADWTQRSKAAAGRLTRVLVNKGLPWPTAVQRAAEVAGVPLERLGRYATVAADRQVGDLGLVDAADRVLMEYAKYRGAMESDLVAKSGRVRHRMQERQWDESEVNRDEAGRFAVEAHAVTDDEKAERARRREARQRRRDRRSRKQARQQQVAAPGTGPESSGSRARPRDEVRVPPRGEPRAEKRMQPRDSGPTGVLGFPMVSVRDLPDYHSDAAPVTVNAPLFMVEYFGSAGSREYVLSPAFTETDIDAVVEAIVSYFYPLQTAVSVYRYPPGGLIVQGVNPSEKRTWNGMLGFGLDVGPVVSVLPDSDTAFRRRIPEPAPYQTRPFRNSNGDRVEVRYWNAEMVEAPDKELHSKSTVIKSGRVRYRTANREPWDESEVNRDDRGRFAVEENAQTDQDRAERARRREARRKRKERRARQAARLVAQTQEQRNEETRARQERERVQPAVQRRTEARAEHKVAPREHAGGPEEWLTQAEDGVITEIPTGWIGDLHVTSEIRNRPMFLDELVENTHEDLMEKSNDIPQNVAWQAMEMYKMHESFRRRDSQGNVRDVWQADMIPDEATAITMLRVHSLLHGLTDKSARGVNLQIPHTSTEDLHAELLDLAGAVMYPYGQAVRERKNSPYAHELVDSDDIALAVSMRSGLHDDGPAVTLDKGREARLQVWTGTPNPPNRSFVVRPSRVNDQLALLADFTSPRNTKVGARLYLKAREQIANELEMDQTWSDIELLEAYLSKSELAIEQMPEEQVYELGREVLSMYPDGPVRLDGIDVFCIR